MAKTLYFYSNTSAAANSFRAALQATGLTFTELRLDRDLRKHPVLFPGIQAVIEVDGRLFEEVQNPAQVSARFSAAPSSLPASTPPVLSAEDRDLAEARTLTERHQSSLSALEQVRLNQLMLKTLLKLTGGTR